MRMEMVTVAVLFLSLCGCVMVREGKVKPPVPWPPAANQPAKATIALTVFEEGMPGSRPDLNNPVVDTTRDRTIQARKEQAVKAYRESGFFSSVVASPETADLLAEVNVRAEDSQGFPWSAAFSILTFTIIPGHVTQDLVVTTTYKDRQQRIVGGVEQREGFGSWIEFFLLFAMPFVKGPDAMMDEARYDMHRTTILEARSKGFF